MTSILGISAFYHDSAAALITDGEIIAAAQEERFTRKKHDAGFPVNAVNYCLDESGTSITNLDSIVFYDKPILKFDRLLETYLSYSPRGFKSFLLAMPVWLKEKLYLKSVLKKELSAIGRCKPDQLPGLLFTEHHQAHAASAFYPAPFENAAVLCMDGVGEWATTSVWSGQGNSLTPLWEMDFPHSLGLLYSAFTYFTGFKVNSGEYKLMGLAPYGEPEYVDVILDNLLDLKEDGTFRMDMQYFDYSVGLCMTSQKFNQLFGGPPRRAENPVTLREMNIARSIQVVTEEIVLRLARTVRKETGSKKLCMAGGVALNCVANGRLLREAIFDDIWVQPAAGDAGGAVGAALSVWYEYLGNERIPDNSDKMSGSYLGPAYSSEDIRNYLDSVNAEYTELAEEELLNLTATLLADENVIGWFQGRMEFGPRALGGRSILGDPRSKTMQSVMNLKIKYRESFRPFAPSVISERVEEYFEMQCQSPYMLLVAELKNDLRLSLNDGYQALSGIEKLNVPRSSLPAITHVDYSARIQTVDNKTNPRYYGLLKKFEELTGCAVLVNTSFNVRGEPIVCKPEDAYRCFMRTEMDYLVLGNFLLTKSRHPISRDNSWQQEFALD